MWNKMKKVARRVTFFLAAFLLGFMLADALHATALKEPIYLPDSGEGVGRNIETDAGDFAMPPVSAANLRLLGNKPTLALLRSAEVPYVFWPDRPDFKALVQFGIHELSLENSLFHWVWDASLPDTCYTSLALDGIYVEYGGSLYAIYDDDYFTEVGSWEHDMVETRHQVC